MTKQKSQNNSLVNKQLRSVKNQSILKSSARKNDSSTYSVISSSSCLTKTSITRGKKNKNKTNNEPNETVIEIDNNHSDDSEVETESKQRRSKYPSVNHLFEQIGDELFKCISCDSNDVAVSLN